MNKKCLNVIMGSLILIISLWFIKDFRLSWVEAKEGYAEITVNFLVPMYAEHFEKYVGIQGGITEAHAFDYTYEWLTDSVVKFKIKEVGNVQGQKIKLVIKEAPSKWKGLNKTVQIPIQFKANVQLLAPVEMMTIATTQSFKVQFNTPMNIQHLKHYIQSEASFSIEQGENTTSFIFTPKKALENNKRYTVLIKEGAPSMSGSTLQQTQLITLQTDIKPLISDTYPKDGDKWIGLYPKLTLVSQTPIVNATLNLGKEHYEGKLIDEYHAYFILNNILDQNTIYEAIFQTEAETGELSEPYKVNFTTTQLDEKHIWLEVLIGEPSKVKVYKGTKLIRTMICSVGKKNLAPSLGTYYLEDKNDVFEDVYNKEGANYWLKINEKCGFQGAVRDSYWKIKEYYINQLGARIDRKNIILDEEDAKWLYENVSIESMIIIKNN